MRKILIASDVKGAGRFRDLLSTNASDFEVILSADVNEFAEVEVLIIWFNAPAYLSELPNLRLVLVCGSGIDHLVGAVALPPHVPLVRLVDPYLRQHVAHYLLEHVRKQYFPSLSTQNLAGDQRQSLKLARKPKIGIMGLGLVGESVARNFISLGFNVSGWVRTARPRSIQEVYVGSGQLRDFAKSCEVLVCQLPLTNETKGVLNAELFDLLPDGAYLINVGRGDHLVEADLLLALESGKLSGACLDVFQVEPLPLEHPFNAHPKITTTPHIAGYIEPETQAPYAAHVIDGFYRGESVEGVVDFRI